MLIPATIRKTRSAATPNPIILVTFYFVMSFMVSKYVAPPARTIQAPPMIN